MPSSPFDNAADSGTSFPPQTSQIPSASVASSPQVSFSQPTPTAPAFALKMEPESTISSMNTTSSMMSEEMNHYN
ncbi:hypothetical protein KAZ93_00765 [Patescibacteria group bacterium]|nr:hypothetical protein [Patescibacteria group bacterium]